MNRNHIFLLFLLIPLFLCYSSKEQKEYKNQKTKISIIRECSGLKLQAKFIGRFSNYGDTEMEMPELFLAQVNLINDTDSTVKFFSQRAGPILNVVFDNKDLTMLGPSFLSNSRGGDLLYPGQILTFPVIFYANKDFDNKDLTSLKIGFILLSWEKSYKLNDKLFELIPTWRKTYENVIWSDPIDLSINKQHNSEYLRIINDTTIAYSKH